MRILIKSALVILTMSISHACIAGNMEDGFSAAQKGDISTAYQTFKPFAEQGNVSAQYFIGWMYENGQGVAQDNKAAIKWYSHAAEKGYAPAQRNLSSMYANGKGVTQDQNIARKLYQLVSVSEELNAGLQYNLGWMYGSNPNGDYATAFRIWNTLAQKGDAHGQNQLACMYMSGQGIVQDNVQAVKWYSLAAEQGNIDAQIILGKIYTYGQNVPRDYKAALKWYSRAAEKGNSEAQYYLGEMYEKGEGVVKDQNTAIKWYSLAAEQGHESAIFSLALKYYKGDGVLRDYKRAAQLYSLSAEKGNYIANLNLGIMYMNGIGVEQDHVEAYTHFEIAATNKNKDAIKYRNQIIKKMDPAQIERANNLIKTKIIEAAKFDFLIGSEKDSSADTKQLLAEARSASADSVMEHDRQESFDVYQHILKSFRSYSNLPNCIDSFRDSCWGRTVNISDVNRSGERFIDLFEGEYQNNQPNGFGIRVKLEDRNENTKMIFDSYQNIDFKELNLSEKQILKFTAGIFNNGHLDGLALTNRNQNVNYLLGIATRGVINGEAIELNKFNGIVSSGYYFNDRQHLVNPVNLFENQPTDVKEISSIHFINYKSQSIHFCKVLGKFDDCFGTYFTTDGYKKGILSNGKLNGYGCYFKNNGYHICGLFRDDDAYYGYISTNILDGIKYEGEIKNSLPHGQGRMLGDIDNLIVGKFSEGKLLGSAIIIDRWSIYRGDFINGSKNGAGISYASDCRTISEQMWNDNNLINEKTRSVNQEDFNHCVSLKNTPRPDSTKWLKDADMSYPLAALNISTDLYYKDKNFDPSGFEFD